MLTPMLQQYFSIKKKYPNAILFFRLGDFYEMFGADAQTASPILNITLTARNKGQDSEIPMCGVPYHAVDNYLGKLTKKGYKVAICEQTSSPDLPGLVKREVVRVVTPGTTLDSQLLNDKKNNFLAAVIFKDDGYFLSFADLSTGQYKVAAISQESVLKSVLSKLAPKEIIIDDLKNLPGNNLAGFLKELCPINSFCLPVHEDPEILLQRHFKVAGLESFGLKSQGQILAAALLLGYLQETQKAALDHILKIGVYNPTKYMLLDEATIRNLDLIYNSFYQGEQGTLLSVLDQTITAGGGRLLRQWLLHPLLKEEDIARRLQTVKFFKVNAGLAENLKLILKKTSDIERILGRIGCGRALARDLLGLKSSLQEINKIKNLLAGQADDFISRLNSRLSDQSILINELEQALSEDAGFLSEGNVIKKGYNQELDELKNILNSGKEFIKNLQVQEQQRTKINSLKVKYNTVFGYYLEVSKSNLHLVPSDYIRKQTLVNAERFITPALKEYEEKVLTAQNKILQLEQKLFLELLEKIKPHFTALQRDAVTVATLDVLSNFAFIASVNNYCQPQIGTDMETKIISGRHPVIEKYSQRQDYIPNDLLLNNTDHQLLLITGPNMAGKSSYLRQTALLVLMAQLGSFIPAKEAQISICDRIFTRVGASDNLAAGQSTFMVEMQEAANILHNATSQSLIILDELGRGTSTYDGLSLAWAVMEYIYYHIKAKTLFATHYHELIEVVQNLPQGKNYSLAVKETEQGVIFLYQIIKGGANRSYGIEVAKLAGLPQEVIGLAVKFLLCLENAPDKKNKRQQTFGFEPIQDRVSEVQTPHELSDKAQAAIDQLLAVNVNELTPLQALNLVQELQTKVKERLS